ncbi:MAG: aminotransferase class V-fold PLP-dependent enzyme [Desulfobacterales bacterium]
MKTYPIPMVPGPVSVPRAVLDAFADNYGSADMEAEFFDLYDRTASGLQEIMATANTVVLQSGEGMVVLWSALKNCLLPGDRVLSVATGLFGHGIAEMAGVLGAEVRKVSLPDDRTISETGGIEEAIEAFKPKMITAVHCETPSGTLNPLADLGRLKKAHGVPLFYVDAVSSIGGAPVLTDDWNIDLCLGGAQKCLSAPPDMAFLSVSEEAWAIVEQVDYSGYDALKPFRGVQKTHSFPYTPNWHGLAALNAGVELILAEGPAAVFERHARVADTCRRGLTDMGLTLFPAPGSISSPTVTAVYLPGSTPWVDFDQKLRRRGLVVGGSYGKLAGKIFRLGHMGSQADETLVRRALDAIAAGL